MNTIDIDRLANAINILRPDWDVDDLVKFLTRTATNRPLWDAARVLTWIALEPGAIPGQYVHQTPTQFSKPGPWWSSITVTDLTPVPIGWCSLHRCEDSARNPCRHCITDRAAAVTQPDEIHSHIAAIRAQIKPTTNPLAQTTSEETTNADA